MEEFVQCLFQLVIKMTSTDTLFALRNISSPNEHLVTLFGRSLQEGLQTKDPRTGGTSANFENETKLVTSL